MCFVKQSDFPCAEPKMPRDVNSLIPVRNSNAIEGQLVSATLETERKMLCRTQC